LLLCRGGGGGGGGASVWCVCLLLLRLWSVRGRRGFRFAALFGRASRWRLEGAVRVNTLAVLCGQSGGGTVGRRTRACAWAPSAREAVAWRDNLHPDLLCHLLVSDTLGRDLPGAAGLSTPARCIALSLYEYGPPQKRQHIAFVCDFSRCVAPPTLAKDWRGQQRKTQSFSHIFDASCIGRVVGVRSPTIFKL